MPIFNCRSNTIRRLIIILGAHWTYIFKLITLKIYKFVVERDIIAELTEENVCNMESFPPKFETFLKEGYNWEAKKQHKGIRNAKK